MKAIVMREFGGPDVLELADVPDPEPGPDDVVVEVHAVTVNRTLDLKVRAAGHARGTVLPHVLGVDPAGVVVARGNNVQWPDVGARVAVVPHIRCGHCRFCRAGQEEDCPNSRHIGVHQWGGYAQYARVPASNVHLVPDNVPFADAAVVLRHAPTAFNLLRARGRLAAGEWALIMGASGGLGNAGVQIAKLMGATVIAGAGADERVQAGLAAGADHGVNYRRDDLADEVHRITGGAGVNLVFENISDPDVWPLAFASLAPSGRLVTAGAHGGGVVPLDVRRLYGRRLQVIGGAGATREDMVSALDAAARGQLRPLIDRVLPLDAAVEAHRLAEADDLVGKVVLDPTAIGRAA